MRAEHPLRRTVVNEMHLRRWPRFTAPASIVQYLRMVEDGAQRMAEQQALEALGGGPLAPGQRHLIGTFAPGIRLCWERHNEATTLTLFLEGVDAVLAMRDDPRLALALDWAEAMPGTVLRATRVAVVADEAEAQSLLPRLAFRKPIWCPAMSARRPSATAAAFACGRTMCWPTMASACC